MKFPLLKAAIFFMKIIYAPMKLFPTRNKVTFISRGNDFTSIDFQLLGAEIKRQSPKTRVVYLNHPIGNKILYVFKILSEMSHISTSRAVVLDTYNIPISLLKHKKSLIVMQIWHALGAFKAFGLMALNKDEGSSARLAQAMQMHKNYTYVSAPSKAIAEIYKQAFGLSNEQIVLAGSPRVDYLKNDQIQKLQRQTLRKKYGIAEDKEVILFAPTFRKNSAIPITKLIENIDFDKYSLVFRGHPLDKLTPLNDPRLIIPTEKEGIELLALADHLITDYSAIVFEAALLDIPCYFWAYDHDEYSNKRGFILDFESEAPGPVLKDISELSNFMETLGNPSVNIKEFKAKYLESFTFNNSLELTKLLLLTD